MSQKPLMKAKAAGIWSTNLWTRWSVTSGKTLSQPSSDLDDVSWGVQLTPQADLLDPFRICQKNLTMHFTCKDVTVSCAMHLSLGQAGKDIIRWIWRLLRKSCNNCSNHKPAHMVPLFITDSRLQLTYFKMIVCSACDTLSGVKKSLNSVHNHDHTSVFSVFCKTSPQTTLQDYQHCGDDHSSHQFCKSKL